MKRLPITHINKASHSGGKRGRMASIIDSNATTGKGRKPRQVLTTSKVENGENGLTILFFYSESMGLVGVC